MNYEYVVDSSAWIEYFSGSEKGRKIKEIIENKVIAISIITVAELADKFIRERKIFDHHLLFIQSKASIISLTIPIVLAAARIKAEIRKRQPKFGLADALQMATAQEKEAILLTTDNDFSGLKNVFLIR